MLLLLTPVCAILLLLNLAGLVNALPGQVRGRLPDAVISMVTTPLPTALPAPRDVVSRPIFVAVPTLAAPTATEIAISPSDAGEAQTVMDTATHLASQPATIVANTPFPTPVPTATSLPLPRAMNLVGPEIVPQQFNNCGPANLSIVLNYFGHETDQQEIGQALKPNYDDRNVSPHELVAFVNENTLLRSEVFRGGNLSLLKRLLAAGIPVIIEKGLLLNRELGWMGHYLTLVGYREAGEQFYTLDTFLGPWDNSGRLDDYETLETLWSQFNHTFVVVYRPEDEQLVHAILGPDLTDPMTMWQKAALSAQRSLDNEEEDAFAWFNLGASLTHLGELSGDASYYENAALAFDRARTIGLPWRMLWYQFEPYVAYLATGRLEDVRLLTEAILSDSGGRDVEETHLYQGYALLAAGDSAGAERAYRRALRLNPSYDEAQAALASLP